MDWADIEPRDLIDLSASGVHRFAEARTVLVDADVLNLWRRLIQDSTASERVASQLRDVGYIQGWRLAGRLLGIIPSNTETEAWQFAAHCARWAGLGQRADARKPHLTTSIAWRHSPEATSPTPDTGSSYPLCLFLSGFFGGCVSRLQQRPIACDEERCVAQGHSACYFALRSGNVLPDSEVRWLLQLQEWSNSRPEARPAEPSPAAESPDQAALGVRSPQMREIMSLARRVAPVDLTVLITGESGVGKERLASFVHQQSKRAGHPYVPVNCAALPDALLESELFGHRRGAFTGALDDHEGLFEAANTGTLFLDEIGELSLGLQAKLLRVLGEQMIRRVGDTTYRRIDVRVIAATNRDLVREIHAGRFREDLYYRLNGISLHIPPLRERPEDLRDLLRLLLDNAARKLDRQIMGFAPRALGALLGYAWTGNIRELENAIDRACAVALGTHIDLRDLPDTLRRPARNAPARFVARPLEEVEREHVLTTLAAARGNRTRAAEMLQISRQTMSRRLRAYRASTTAAARPRPT